MIVGKAGDTFNDKLTDLSITEDEFLYLLELYNLKLKESKYISSNLDKHLENKGKIVLNGYTFKNIKKCKDNIVYVRFSNGVEIECIKERAREIFKEQYLIKFADKICIDTLNELGYTVENIHLANSRVHKQFRKILESKLSSCDFDNLKGYVETPKIRAWLSGNICEISSIYKKRLVDYKWYASKMTFEQMKENFKLNRRSKLYVVGYNSKREIVDNDKAIEYLDRLRSNIMKDIDKINIAIDIINRNVNVFIDDENNIMLHVRDIVNTK